MIGTKCLGLQFEKHVDTGREVKVLLILVMLEMLTPKKSLTSYFFNVFGRPVSWKSKLKSIVVLSTTKAEYIAMTKAIKEAISVIGITHNLGLFRGVVAAYCDNQSSIHLTKNCVV